MSNIKVAVRCRPLFEREKAASGLDIQSRRILLDSKTYDPDYTFSPTATQDDVYGVCMPILQCVKDGLNGTVMVYGQTGTGKTFTMLGCEGRDNGLVHKIIAHMLEHVQQKTVDGDRCALALSMVEIYNEKMTDMLSPNGDEEVTLVGGFPRSTNKVTLCRLSDASEAVTRGLAWRHTAPTMMNERSSRSHVVFIIDLEEYNAFTEQFEVAHLFLVDLAGSESLKKSQASGATACEAGKINKSLLALKSVFLALSNTNEATRPGHVPYRDSRLTELLQDSIGGTARTLMIACISSVGRDIEETKSTLMYAVKARSIKNATNSEKEKLLIRLRSIEVENQKLRNRLEERVAERGGYYVTKEDHERIQQLEDANRDLRNNVALLLKDRESNEASKHISESETKILQAMVQDKEAELQNFKAAYQGALQQFDSQAAALQRVMASTLAEVRRTAQCSSQQDYGKLERWRASMISILNSAVLAEAQGSAPCPVEVPLGYSSCTSASVSVVPEETLDAIGCGVSASVHAESSSVSATHGPVVARGSSRGSVLNPRHSAMRSDQGSPTRKTRRERRGNESVASRQCSPPPTPQKAPVSRQLELVNERSGSSPKRTLGAVTTLPSPAATAISEVCPSFLSSAMQEIQSVVNRINGVFTNLVHDLLVAHHQHRTVVDRLEAKRSEKLNAACSELRAKVEEGLQRLLREEARSARDVAESHAEMQDRLRLIEQYPPPACCIPFEHVVCNACLATVNSVHQVFPSSSLPVEVDAAIDNVRTAYQSKYSSISLDALGPLSTMASPRISSAPPNVAPPALVLPPLSGARSSGVTLSDTLPRPTSAQSSVCSPAGGACENIPSESIRRSRRDDAVTTGQPFATSAARRGATSLRSVNSNALQASNVVHMKRSRSSLSSIGDRRRSSCSRFDK